MSAHPHLLSPQQYLDIERAAEFRSEYYKGRMYAMSGGSLPHAVLIASLAREFGIALKKGRCRIATSDLRLRVSADGLYTYPDVIVFCGEPQVADDQKDTILNPTVVMEVLSPATEAYDRGWKFSQYRKIESLREYVLVSQSRPCLEVFERRSVSGAKDGEWVLSEVTGLEAVCQLKSLDCSVALADIYDNFTFATETAARPPAVP
jgi:Uma2 family endonuclease